MARFSQYRTTSIPTAGDNSTIDPILENLDTVGMSRRDVVRMSAVGLALAGVGVACGNGGGGAAPATTAAPTTAAPTTAAPTTAAPTTTVSVVSAKEGRLAHLILTPNQYTRTMAAAGEQTAEVLGLSAYTEGNTNLDPVNSVDLARQYIGSGHNMIWVSGIDGSEVRPINEAATPAEAYHSQMWAAGPWFMPVDTNEFYTAFWDLHDPPNIYGSTRLMLEELANRLGSTEGTIFHIAGFPGGSLAFRRTAGVHQAIDEFPTLNLVGELPGSWDPVLAQQAFQDLVGRHGKPDGVVCSNDAMLTGVLPASEGLGYVSGEDVLFCGQDGNPDILNDIESGRVFSTNFHGPHTFAVHPIVRMYDTLQGAQFSPLERQMWVNGIHVTQDNVSGLISRYYGAENRLPFDPILVSRVHNPDTWDPQTSLAPIDIVTYWDGIADRPSGYELPADYVAAVDAGAMQEVEDLYESHYQIKMDNFDFTGIQF